MLLSELLCRAGPLLLDGRPFLLLLLGGLAVSPIALSLTPSVPLLLRTIGPAVPRGCRELRMEERDPCTKLSICLLKHVVSPAEMSRVQNMGRIPGKRARGWLKRNRYCFRGRFSHIMACCPRTQLTLDIEAVTLA